MKRLLILTLLMTPLAVTTVHRFVETSKTGVPVRPRTVFLTNTDKLESGESLVVVENKYPMATAESATEAAWRAVEERLVEEASGSWDTGNVAGASRPS